MLLNFIISAFKIEEDTKNTYPHAGLGSSSNYNKGTVIVGLKILIQNSKGKSKIVEKPAALGSARSAPSDQYSCYLKACHLCNKKFSLDKDIYMYRGDIGFCSVECRERQIYLDEMKELEISTMKILKSNNYRHCNNGGADRRETRILLEELRQERHHSKTLRKCIGIGL